MRQLYVTKRSEKRIRKRGALISVAVTLLLLWQAKAAMSGVANGMRLCAHTMIPALFPFMAVSEWMVRSEAGEMLTGCWPLRRLGDLLGLSQAGFCAFLMGCLCGFPIGARVAAAYYRSGRLTEGEFSAVLCTCNLPSGAFLVNAVGVGLFGSAALGRWLCLLSFLSALSVGICMRAMGLIGKTEQSPAAVASPRQERAVSLPSVLSTAARSMLSVCATVILFGSLTSVLTSALGQAGLSPGAPGGAFLLGFLELSGGVSETVSAFPTASAAVICAVLVGWGGLSVHCQIFSECEGCPVKKSWFWLSRAGQALLCGGGMLLLIRSGAVVPERLITEGAMVPVGHFPADTRGRILWGVGIGGMVIALGCAVYLKRTKRRAYGRSVETAK